MRTAGARRSGPITTGPGAAAAPTGRHTLDHTQCNPAPPRPAPPRHNTLDHTQCYRSPDRPWHTRPVRRLLLPPLLLLAAAACGNDDEVMSDAVRFCDESAASRDLIVTPPLETEAELEATLDFYRLMGQLAPLAIADEWNDLLVNLETASTVVPGDPASEQLVAMTAYATEPSAYAVKKWLLANCGVDIPITTIAPQEQVPAATTTAPTTATSSSADG